MEMYIDSHLAREEHLCGSTDKMEPPIEVWKDNPEDPPNVVRERLNDDVRRVSSPRPVVFVMGL